MIDPTLYSDYRAAKKAAAVLANATGATLLQTEKGKPRVVLGKLIKDFPTWLAAWSFLHRVRLDQIGTKAQEPPPVAKRAPPIPMAIILPDLEPPPKKGRSP